MTRDDIIRMAREAGFDLDSGIFGDFITVDGISVNQELERFAALVAAAEREACKDIARTMEHESWADYQRTNAPVDDGKAIGAGYVALLISQRGQT